MSQAGSANGGGGGGSGVLILNYTAVSTSPYVVQTNDEVLGVDTSSISITIRLPDSVTTGRVYHVKDVTGSAPLRNITITTVSGVVLIDSATSFIINSSFESVQVLFNGTKYIVL